MKSMFSTGHTSMSQTHSVKLSTKFDDVFSMYLIALGFCVLSRKISICTRNAIHEKRLKIVHSNY